MTNNEDNNKSEVARIKQQIKAEYESAQRGLAGFHEGASKHEFITARMENMGKHHEKHKDLVGDEEAMQFLMGVIEDEEQLRQLFAEFTAVPSYFERFARERQAQDGKE